VHHGGSGQDPGMQPSAGAPPEAGVHGQVGGGQLESRNQNLGQSAWNSAQLCSRILRCDGSWHFCRALGQATLFPVLEGGCVHYLQSIRS
jgi:hypothetical protein